MTNIITNLTANQKQKITEYRDRYFVLATSTEPADRPCAEATARALADIDGIKIERIVWVDSPQDGAKAYRKAVNGRAVSPKDQSKVPLGASLNSILSTESWRLLFNKLGDVLWDALWVPFSTLLSDTLWDTSWDPLWDSQWLATYTYAVNVLNVKCSGEHRTLLKLFNKVAASAFALWLAPGTAVLCERPAVAKTRDGQLVGLEWRNT